MKLILILAMALAAQAQTVLNTGNANWTVVSSAFSPNPSACLGELQVGSIYIQTQNPNNGPIRVLRCAQTGDSSYTWQPIGHTQGPVLPGKCAVGELFFRTGVTPGLNVYGCTSTNVWTPQAGGSGGAPAFSAVTAGTNTATLVVGTGGTLSTSGSGTIAATTAVNLTPALSKSDGKYCVQITSGLIDFTTSGCPGSGGSTLFDSATGLFDSAAGLFDAH